MGIRFLCPNGHKLNVKAFQAGRRGICPYCGAKFQIPTESTIPSGKASQAADSASGAGAQPTTFEQKLEEHIQSAEESPRSPAWSGSPTGTTAPMDESAAEEPNSLGNSDNHASTDAEGSTTKAQTSVAPPTASNPEPPAPSGPDPLADAPNAVWYVRPPSGGQFGPAQPDMMRSWLAEGRVSAETLVWREGWPDWQEAGAVFPQLRPASPGPEAPPIAAPGADTQTYRGNVRRRNHGSKLGLVIVLAMAVLLLIAALVFALTRKNSSDQGGSVANLPVAEASTSLQASSRGTRCMLQILS